ncbi:MAG: hypothetical protein ACRDL7_13045, partial [Gaiellaceae bacterium]
SLPSFCTSFCPSHLRQQTCFRFLSPSIGDVTCNDHDSAIPFPERQARKTILAITVSHFNL